MGRVLRDVRAPALRTQWFRRSLQWPRGRPILFRVLARAILGPGQLEHRHRPCRRDRSGRVRADGHASWTAEARPPSRGAERSRVQSANGGIVRIQAGFGQDRLRAPLVRPGGSAQGAADRLNPTRSLQRSSPCRAFRSPERPQGYLAARGCPHGRHIHRQAAPTC